MSFPFLPFSHLFLVPFPFPFLFFRFFITAHSPAVLKLEEGARDGQLSQFYLSLSDKDDKFLVVFAFIKLGLLEVRQGLLVYAALL